MTLPVLVDPQTLNQHLDDENLLIIDLSMPEVYQLGHVPGAINADPKKLLLGEGPVPNKLPTLDQLSTLFSSLGLLADTQVVIYDDQMGPWAGRMLWTLDLLGHEKTSVLNGQLGAWAAAGLPLEGTINEPLVSSYRAEIKHPELIADVDYILSTLADKSNTVVWDARTAAEYSGEKKVNCAKGGHIPGAKSFDWLGLHVSKDDYRIRPEVDLLAELNAQGITADKEIITHCQTHRRSGFTYLVAKSLGFKNLRCYDGSWFEWGNHPDTPVEAP